jgi:hypothetical protein
VRRRRQIHDVILGSVSSARDAAVMGRDGVGVAAAVPSSAADAGVGNRSQSRGSQYDDQARRRQPNPPRPRRLPESAPDLADLSKFLALIPALLDEKGWKPASSS